MPNATGPLPMTELLTLIKHKDFTLGWSAVVAYDRDKANRLLAQEYTDRYGAGYMPRPLTGAFEDVSSDDKTWVGGVTFDAPRLDFDEPGPDGSSATLTWQSLDGPVLRLRSFGYTGRPSAWEIVEVRYETAINGGRFTRRVDLNVVDPQMGRFGEVYFDLSGPDLEGSAHYSLIPGRAAQTKAAEVLLRWLGTQAPGVRRFTLNRIRAGDDLMFKPTRIKVRVHPGPKRATGASQDSSGAILLFMAADGASEGNLPNPESYDYPLAQGYGATFILNQAYALRRFLELALTAISVGRVAFSPAQGIPMYASVTTGGLLTTPIPRREFSGFAFHVPAQLLPFAAGVANSPLTMGILSKPSAELIELALGWHGSTTFELAGSLYGGPWGTYHVEVRWRLARANLMLVEADRVALKGDGFAASLEVIPLDFPAMPPFLENSVAKAIETALKLADILPFSLWIVTVLHSSLGLFNKLRLNTLLFDNPSAVGAEIIRMAQAPVMFGQVSPSRTRFSLCPRRDGVYCDSVAAAGILLLSIEDTEVCPARVDWALEPVVGAASGADLGQVTRQGSAYVYLAPRAAALAGDYLVLRVVARASFSGDAMAYEVRTLIKVYRDTVQVAPKVRLLEPNENLYLAVSGLDGGAVAGRIDSPTGPVNERLAVHADSLDPAYNWRYQAPSATLEREGNQPSRPGKPLAVSYRTLVFSQGSSGQGLCQVVVPYYRTTLSIDVLWASPLQTPRRVCLQARWKHDGSAALPSDGLHWSLPLGGAGATLDPQADGTVVLGLPNSPLRSFIVVEARRFFEPDEPHTLPPAIDAWRWGNAAPPAQDRPDYLGLRLFPLPWLAVPDPS